MIHTDIEVYLNRGRFVRWTIMAGQFNSYILKDAKDDLVLGGEHITSIEGLLKYCQKLPGYILGVNVPDHDWVDVSCIKLTFNRKEKV